MTITMAARASLLIMLFGVALGVVAAPAPAPVPVPVSVTEAPAPVRVVEPAAPGEHLPSRGRSLFEELFAVRRGDGSVAAQIDVPFPFAALLAHLDAQLQHDPASPLPPTKRVLIPLGRSLQRSAAAPDYFAYPRVVVAVDSQSAAAGLPLLKDRLYLGYQEQSAVIEIIAYNEDAGRFEFQLLKDYRAGGKPRLVYANRNICFACHQNGAPIFSRALWDETNANPRVAALLLASGQRFYGIPPERGIDVPYAIDNASERANALALTQRLWREACGVGSVAARRCRAGLFTAALRHALSGGQTWTPDAAFERDVAQPLRSEARRRWPGGLAAGNPDIPNRNPLQGTADWPAERAARVALSHVAARFDPLLSRPAGEVWRSDAANALRPAVAGLAEFIAAPDARLLATALARSPSPPATRRLTLPCRIDSRAASRWSLRCAAADGTLLVGTLAVQAGKPTGGRLARLTLPGGTALNNLELSLVGRASSSAATLLPQVAGLPARTAAAEAIAAIDLQRLAGSNPGEDSDAGGQGELTLLIRDDFALVQQAVERLLAGPEGDRLFAPQAFPRRQLFAALLGELGAKPPPPCCAAATQLPPAQLEVLAVAPGEHSLLSAGSGDPALQGFQPYCAACHQSAETFPPNFLSGGPAEVAARLRHCAPRLYVRLAMVDVAPAQREKTPMPPESMLPAFASDAQAWRSSPARAAMLVQVEQWLRAETGQAPQVDRLLAAGYEALRPCLPPQ